MEAKSRAKDVLSITSESAIEHVGYKICILEVLWAMGTQFGSAMIWIEILLPFDSAAPLPSCPPPCLTLQQIWNTEVTHVECHGLSSILNTLPLSKPSTLSVPTQPTSAAETKLGTTQTYFSIRSIPLWNFHCTHVHLFFWHFFQIYLVNPRPYWPISAIYVLKGFVIAV